MFLARGFIFTIALVFAATAMAGIPHEFFVNPQFSHTEAVSICTLPGGDGDPLTEAYTYGGNRTDASIHITLEDYNRDPVPFFPAEDIWLYIYGEGTLAYCAGGGIADGPTDINGQASFSEPLRGGGALPPYQNWALNFMVVGADLCADCTEMQLFVNSPDINADLAVDLTDVVLFTQDFWGSYDYRSDFFWDGVINLSDLVRLAWGFGSHCP